MACRKHASMNPRALMQQPFTMEEYLDLQQLVYRVTEAVLPTLRVVPNPRVERYVGVESLGWVLPIDDTHFRIYVVGRVRSSW